MLRDHRGIIAIDAKTLRGSRGWRKKDRTLLRKQLFQNLLNTQKQSVEAIINEGADYVLQSD
jgi:hypothetical protein